jgi:hypothetical protein
MMSIECSKHAERWNNKYIEKSVSSWFNKNYIEMHGQRNIKRHGWFFLVEITWDSSWIEGGGPYIWFGRFSEEKSILNSVCVFRKVAIPSSLRLPSIYQSECKDNLSPSGYHSLLTSQPFSQFSRRHLKGPWYHQLKRQCIIPCLSDRAS